MPASTSNATKTATAAASAGALTLHDDYAPRSGNGGYTVDAYDLDLRYRVARNHLEATAVIMARSTQALSRFSLDLVHLRAHRVRVDGRKVGFAQQTDKLVVTLPSKLPADAAFTVTVEYSGAPRPRNSHWGAIGWEELDDGVLVASQPTGAPSWFPCNDHPADKARFRIRVNCEQGYAVIANGRPVGTPQTSSGRTTWTFEQPEPTATYLATVQIGRYVRHEREFDGVPGVLAHPAALASRVHADFAVVDRMMALFQQAFGPYPFERYALVITADDLEIPLEAQGMAVFGANHADGEGGAERLVAHELAHQWFGNSVGLASWRHIWLNEGLCCYAEWIWGEAAGGRTTDAAARRHHSSLAALPQDLLLGDPGPRDMFDDRVYKRGALTVHALRLTIGDDAFFTLLRRWTDERAHGTAATEDFVALAGEVAGRPLDGFFEPWLARLPLPALPPASASKRSAQRAWAGRFTASDAHHAAPRSSSTTR